MVMLCTWNWFCSCYIIMFLFWRRCIGILFFLSFCVYSSRIHGVLNFVNPTNRLTCELTIFKSEIMYTKLITSANFVFFFIIPSNFFFLYSTDFTLVSRAYFLPFFSFLVWMKIRLPTHSATHTQHKHILDSVVTAITLKLAPSQLNE